MINAVGQDTSAPPSATAASDTGEPGVAAEADFQTFLSLLTAQLRNQDPLQPLDSTEFVAQLAGFSAVEQQIETNTKLDSLIDALSGGGFDSAANWIGKDVEIQSADLAYDGATSIDLRGSAPAAATSGALTITDASGAVIKTLPLGIGAAAQTVTWDGTRDDGTPAAAGTYHGAIAWKTGEDIIRTDQPLLQDRVTEVRFDQEKGTLQMTLASGLAIPLESIKAVLQPDPEPI